MSDSEKNNEADMADAVKSSPSSTDRSVISATRQPSSNSDDELDSLTENGATYQSSSDQVINTDNGQSQFSSGGDALLGQPSMNSVDALLGQPSMNSVDSLLGQPSMNSVDALLGQPSMNSVDAPISTRNIDNWLKTSNEFLSERQIENSSAGTYDHTRQSEKSLPQNASQSSVRNKSSKISGSNTTPYKRKPRPLGGNAQSQNNQFPKLLPQTPTILTDDSHSPKALQDTLETKSVGSGSSWDSFHSNYFLRSRASSDTSSELKDEFYPFIRPFHPPTDCASNYRSQYECQSRPRHSSESRVAFGHSSRANVLSQTGYLPRIPFSNASTCRIAGSFQEHNYLPNASNYVSRTGDSQRVRFSSRASARRDAYLPIRCNAAWYTGQPLIALSQPTVSDTNAQLFQGYGQSPYNPASILGFSQTPFYSSTNSYRTATSHGGRRHFPRVRYNVASFTGLPLINFKSYRDSFRSTTPYGGRVHSPNTSHEVDSHAGSSSRTHHSPEDTGDGYSRSHSKPEPPVESNDNKSQYKQSPEASRSLERPVYHDRNQRDLRRTVSNPETSSKASECNLFSPASCSQEPDDSSETEFDQ